LFTILFAGIAALLSSLVVFALQMICVLLLFWSHCNLLAEGFKCRHVSTLKACSPALRLRPSSVRAKYSTASSSITVETDSRVDQFLTRAFGDFRSKIIIIRINLPIQAYLMLMRPYSVIRSLLQHIRCSCSLTPIMNLSVRRRRTSSKISTGCLMLPRNRLSLHT
jgi:hypothetical protein